MTKKVHNRRPNPLENFGLHAADHLRGTDSFPNCPDILVNSFYDPEKEEADLIGAASVYQLCKGWVVELQSGSPESEM
jgi:hypothetical protein